MAVTVTYVNGGEAPKSETWDDAATFMETNQSLVLFRDYQGNQPIIAFAPGVWLTAEVT